MAQAQHDNNRTVDVGIGVVLCLVAAAYYGSFFAHIPFAFPDEAYLDYIAFAMNSGQRPYEDIQLYSYLLGPFYLVAGILGASSNSIASVRVLMVVAMVGADALYYAVCREVAPRLVAFIITLTIILVPGPWDRFYMYLLGIALLFFLLSATRRPTFWSAFGFGFTLGCAFALRIDVAVTGVVLALVSAAMTLREVKGTVAGLRGLLGPSVTAATVGLLCFALPYALFLFSRGTLLGQIQQYGEFFSGKYTRIGYAENLAPPALSDLLDMTRVRGWKALIYYGSFAAMLWLVIRCCWLWLTVTPKNAGWTLLKIDSLALLWSLANVPHYALDRPDANHVTMHGAAIFLPIAIALRESLALFHKPDSRALGVVLTSLALLYIAIYVGTFVHTGDGGTIGVAQASVSTHRLSNGMEVTANPASPESTNSRIPDRKHFSRRARGRLSVHTGV